MSEITRKPRMILSLLFFMLGATSGFAQSRMVGDTVYVLAQKCRGSVTDRAFCVGYLAGAADVITLASGNGLAEHPTTPLCLEHVTRGVLRDSFLLWVDAQSVEQQKKISAYQLIAGMLAYEFHCSGADGLKP